MVFSEELLECSHRCESGFERQQKLWIFVHFAVPAVEALYLSDLNARRQLLLHGGRSQVLNFSRGVRSCLDDDEFMNAHAASLPERQRVRKGALCRR